MLNVESKKYISYGEDYDFSALPYNFWKPKEMCDICLDDINKKNFGRWLIQALR